MFRYITVLIAVCLVALLDAEALDNGLTAEPEVECGTDAILINFNTEKAFEGHVYVKGHYDSDECREDATLENSASLSIPFTACNVRRQRSSNPLGLYVSVTVVITFHPMFITMVDKAYNVQCFYMESDELVTAELGVSMLTTQTITQNVPMPTCTYEVLQDDASGAPVRYAAVGAAVYHKWSCGSNDPAQEPSAGMFCMTVHSCNVDNGQGRQVQLLDENGCAADRYLLNNLDYATDVQAGQTSMVFKFADVPTVFFKCQVRLTLKEGDKCERTSDQCEQPIRGKREALALPTGQNVDVYSPAITVFELDAPTPDGSEPLINRPNSVVEQLRQRGAVLAHSSSNAFCMSPVTFGVLVAVLGTVLLICCVALALLFTRRQSAVKPMIN